MESVFPKSTNAARVAEAFSSPPALIGLDRDGTLVPYAERPEDAVVDEALRQLLKGLSAAEDTFVAVVSARSLAQLKIDFGAINNLILAGNYGMEILYPGGTAIVSPQASSIRPQVRAAVQTISPLVGSLTGCILEDHGLSACLHFQAAPAEKLVDVHDLALDISRRFSTLHVRRQPTSYEFLPNFSHGKGDALAAIEQTVLGTEHNRPVFFAGDTEGDESAFAWVNHRHGVSVKIGGEGRPSCAQYQLPSPIELRQFLRLLQGRFASTSARSK